MKKEKPIILGIESSCDDTAAAVLKGGELQSNIISSQLEHQAFGGVVPELASRAHQRLIVPVVRQALEAASIQLEDLDAIAVTYGPGLAGSLLVGLNFAKALALGRNLPLIGVNHLEGHIYSIFLSHPVPPFPYLSLTVSGGHTELTLIKAPFQHEVLGRTRDDAAGEAFDKVAKLLGLSYPGGPKIDRLAQQGNPQFYSFPRAKLEGYDFSFSGLKTSVLYYLNRFSEAERSKHLEKHLPDLAASFQAAVVDVLTDAIRRAVRETGVRHVAIVGGVSANSELRKKAQLLAEKENFSLYIPPLPFCMDNAAMIAMVGHFKWQTNQFSPLTLTAEPALSL